MWIASSDAATQQLKPLNSPPKHCDLLNKVAARARDKWRMMGLQLNIPMDQLNAMTATDPISCYADVFNWWQRNGSPPYTWATIIDALRALIVGEVQLARELEEWVTTVQAPAATVPGFGMLSTHACVLGTFGHRWSISYNTCTFTCVPLATSTATASSTSSVHGITRDTLTGILVYL